MSPFDSHPRELISAWLDGELTPDERTRVIEHLADCSTCRALVDDLTILKQAQREEPIPKVPEELEKRIAWRLRSVKATPPRARWRKLVPLTAVASVAVLGILVVVLREQKLTPTLAPHDLDMRQNGSAPETLAPPPAADEEQERRKSTDSLGEKKEADDLERPHSLGYLGGSKNAESGAMAKQVPAAPSPPAEAPLAGARQKDERPDEPARQPEPAPVQEMAKARATEAPSVAGGAAGSAPSNEAAGSEVREQFAPVPKAAAKSLAAECRSPWSAPEILEGKISRERLAAIVTRLGGTVTPDASESSLYRVELPSAGWQAFSGELGGLGVAKLDRDAGIPAESDCVRVAVRLAP